MHSHNSVVNIYEGSSQTGVYLVAFAVGCDGSAAVSAELGWYRARARDPQAQAAVDRQAGNEMQRLTSYDNSVARDTSKRIALIWWNICVRMVIYLYL